MTDAARKADTSMGFMRPNIGTSPMRLPYRPEASASVRGRPVSEDDELSVLWEVSAKHAHQLKIHAARRAADVIRLRLAKQDHAGAASYARPFEDVMAAMPCPDAEHREKHSDAMEDVCQSEYDRNPCEQTARALLRARATMRAAALDHDREIAARFGIAL